MFPPEMKGGAEDGDIEIFMSKEMHPPKDFDFMFFLCFDSLQKHRILVSLLSPSSFNLVNERGIVFFLFYFLI